LLTEIYIPVVDAPAPTPAAPKTMSSLSGFSLVDVEATPFLYLEARGPFQVHAPKCWHALHGILGEGEAVGDKKKIMAGLSWFDVSKEGDDRFVYQAGLFLKEKLDKEIEGLSTREVSGGRFAKFVLKGNYSQLQEAYPCATNQVVSAGHELREDTMYMEQYLNTYGSVPEEELLTEIYIPVEKSKVGLSGHEVVQFGETSFVYLEAKGPFMESAPKLWGQVGKLLAKTEVESVIGEKRKAKATLTLIDETKEGDDKYVIQAGVMLTEDLAEDRVPAGLQSKRVPGGKFAKFRLTGAYEQLPTAYPSAISQVTKAGESLREGTYFMEMYLNEYRQVPEDELITDIFVPLV